MTPGATRPWPPVNRIVIVCLPPPQRVADLQQTVVSALAGSPQSCQPHMPRAKRRRRTRAVQRRSRITGRDRGRLQPVWVCPLLVMLEGAEKALNCVGLTWYSKRSLYFSLFHIWIVKFSHVPAVTQLCWIHSAIRHLWCHSAQV